MPWLPLAMATTGDDGRIVQLGEWPDDLSGVRTIGSLRDRDVVVRRISAGEKIDEGTVDVGKRLRPNRCRGENVLFVEATPHEEPLSWKALKLP